MKTEHLKKPEEMTIENRIKELCWKLDREVWCHVPTSPREEDAWTTSKAREESNRLITQFVEELGSKKT